MGYNIAVVGATGLVGRTALKVIEQFGLPVCNLKLLASERSEGSTIMFSGREYLVKRLNENSFDGVDIAFFCVNSELSEKYLPFARRAGAVVIDNSSRWRMDRNVPLIVPEINASAYSGGGVIANPNCVTIQCVLPLNAIKKYGLKRVCYTTYQAVSGSGQKGVNALKHALNGQNDGFYPQDISKTCVPMIGDAENMGYTGEEWKMINETRKILGAEHLRVSATCVRVPTPNCHAVCVTAEFEKTFDIDAVKMDIATQQGVMVVDDLENGIYPVGNMADGNDNVYVGRIRRDLSCENGLLFYCVADNLRRGAASNAVKIAMALINQGKIDSKND